MRVSAANNDDEQSREQAGGSREARLPRRGEGATVKILHHEEMCGDAPMLAQAWKALNFGVLCCVKRERRRFALHLH